MGPSLPAAKNSVGRSIVEFSLAIQEGKAETIWVPQINGEKENARHAVEEVAQSLPASVLSLKFV
jgi:hypothetical protein